MPKSKSPATDATRRADDRPPPLHPGEVLGEELIIAHGISSYRVAVDIGVPLPRVNDIVLMKRAMTADMALRLEKYFGVSASFWMGLQATYDLDSARNKIEDELAAIKKFDRDDVAKVVRPRTSLRERVKKARPLKRPVKAPTRD